jgi:S-adenosylmethionine synthetase
MRCSIEFLRHDPSARVACETLLADQCVVVAGEFKTRSPETFRAVRERAVTIMSGVLRDGFCGCTSFSYVLLSNLHVIPIHYESLSFMFLFQ